MRENIKHKTMQLRKNQNLGEKIIKKTLDKTKCIS